MIFLARNWKLIALAILVAGALLYHTNAKREAYQHGFLEATLKAEKATNKAMEELASDADRARFERALCVGSGGLWSFANNECTKRQVEPVR